MRVKKINRTNIGSSRMNIGSTWMRSAQRPPARSDDRILLNGEHNTSTRRVKRKQERMSLLNTSVKRIWWAYNAIHMADARPAAQPLINAPKM